MLKKITARSAMLSLSVLVAACGGGGGGDSGGGGGGGGGGPYTVGGNLTGLTGGSLVLRNNGANDLTVTANGAFTFTATVAAGAAYNVTVATQPTGMSCAVTNGSGTANANVSNVGVSCSAVTTTDTDGDGLTDAEEVARGTSPILDDTDGDSLSDGYEVTNGGFNPLIADLPSVQISVIDAPTIQIDVTDTSTNQLADSFSASYAQGQSSTYSRSDTVATSATVESSTRVYEEAEASSSPTSFGGSAKAGVEASVSASVTAEASTNTTKTSATESRQENARMQEALKSSTLVASGGSLSTTIAVKNTSALSIELSGVEVIAKKRSFENGNATFKPIATLRFEPNGGTSKIMAPDESVQKLVKADDPTVPLLQELMANPSGLQFTVSNYDMARIGGANGPLWPDMSQNVGALTAQVVIDYGANLYDGVHNVERYMVATNVARDANNDPVGITMADVLTKILEVPYETKIVDVIGSDGQPTGATHAVLTAVRSLATTGIETGFWYVYSNSRTLDDPNADFDDIVLKARDRITLVYLADSDGDRIFDREEYLIGTSATLADTDNDGLDDKAEAKEGWDVVVDGQSTHVFSDPLTDDFDNDGVGDADERAQGTDPNDPDTDGDGIDDLNDANPVGVQRISNDVVVPGPGTIQPNGSTVVTAQGSIAAAGGAALTSVTIDWGDGMAVDNVPVSGASVNVNRLHSYAARGSYAVVVTAQASGIPAEAKTLNLTLPPRFTAALGQFTLADGWTEAVNTRLVLDVDGDSQKRADIVGVGPDGVWVSLSQGTGFAAPYMATTEFATDDISTSAFDKNKWPMIVGDFDGNGLPDLAFFADDQASLMVKNYSVPGTYVALNDGAGRLADATLWTTDFSPTQYPTMSVYPRMADDFDGDGRDDIVGFRADGVRIGLSTGNSFVSPTGAGVVIADMGASKGSWTANQPRATGDINGDGYADIVGFGQSYTFVWLNCAGSGPFAGGTCTLPPLATLGFARWSYSNWLSASVGYDYTKHPRLVLDLDGDHDDDVITFANAGTYYAASVDGKLTGNGSLLIQASPQFGYDDGWRIVNDPRMFADISGDGVVDLVGIGPANGPGTDGGVLIAINDGGDDTSMHLGPANQSQVPLWINDFNTYKSVNGDPAQTWNETTYPRRLADVDGDGRADLIAFGDGEVIVEFAAGH